MNHQERLNYFSKITLERKKGNCDVAMATVICIGELHLGSHHNVVAEFISQTAKPGDVVLLEAYPAFIEIPQDDVRRVIYRIPAGVKVKGWEDMKLYAEADKIMDRFEYLQKAMLHPGDISTERYEEVCMEYLETSREVDSIVLLKRNKQLMKVVQQERKKIKKDSRIFVLAGDAHFFEDPKIDTFLSSIKHVVLKTQ